MRTAKIGTARTNAANRRWSCATAQIATRLPTTGNCRYSASTYGVARAAASAAARSASTPSARGVGSTAATGARYGSRYSRFVRNVAMNTTPANMIRPVTGPSTNSSLRFETPFILPPPSAVPRWRRRSCGRGRARVARLPIALKPSHVGDDRPSVCGGDRPAVRRHQPLPIRNDVEDLPVRVLQDLLLVERRGGDIASLEQNAFAVPSSVVAWLAIYRVALPAALDHGVVHGNGNRRDKLPIGALAGEKGLVLFQPADRDRPWNRLAHGRAVEEEHAGGLWANLRLVVHAWIDMDRRATRRAAARAARKGNNCGQDDHSKQATSGDHAAGPSKSGFGLRTLVR